MAVGEYLGNGNPDGTSLGSATTEKISFYGVTPVVQPSGAALATITTTTSVVAAFEAVANALASLGLIKRS